MPIIRKICLNCPTEFNARSQDINRGFGKFCTQRCSSLYFQAQKPKPDPNVECAYCKIMFYKNESQKSNSKSQLYFCCRAHKDLAQRIGGIKEIMPPHFGTAQPNLNSHYRRIAFTNKPKICERCFYDKHPAAIIVHHKDRNRMNDSEDNLEVLCANCHAIEHWSDHDF